MRLSKSEYIGFSVAGLIICVFSLLFYFDFTSRSAVGQERIVGSITFKKRVAQRKYMEQVVWEDIEQKAPVYNNDSIRTAEQSEAVIRLTDGTELMVNENSMILLSMATNEIDIQFRGGSISARRGELAGDAVSKLNIKTGETTVSVANSDVQVSGERDKGLQLTVNKGEATVKAGGKEKAVKQNQKAVIPAESRTMKIITLPLRPLAPHPGSIFIAQGAAATVSFAWEPLKPEQAGFVEISDSVSFKRTIVRKQIAGTAASIMIPPGSYHWRLRSRNRKTGTYDMSDSRNFSVVKVAPASLFYPDNGQVFQYSKNTPVINFKWGGSEITQEYILEISSDPSMVRRVTRYGTPGTSMAVEMTGKGPRYWRVTSLIRVGGMTSRVASGIRTLTVTETKTVEPPVPQFPINGSTVNAAAIKDRGIVFSWEHAPDITSAKLSIADDPGFNNVIFKGTSRTNFLAMHRQLKPGKYFWRMEGILDNNSLTRPSDAMELQIVATDRIKLLAPGEGTRVIREGRDKGIILSWEKADLYGEYIVQVATDRTFSRVIRNERTEAVRAALSGIGPGKYYWRVMLKNNNGSIIMSSRPGSFDVIDALDEPSIISPNNWEAINMDKLDELDLRWKRLDEAGLYRVRFYKIDKKNLTLVKEIMIRGGKIDSSDTNFLEEGKYLWSVQAYEMSPDRSRIIRKSPVSQSHFTIEASAMPRKLKIITPRVIYVE